MTNQTRACEAIPDNHKMLINVTTVLRRDALVNAAVFPVQVTSLDSTFLSVFLVVG